MPAVRHRGAYLRRAYERVWECVCGSILSECDLLTQRKRLAACFEAVCESIIWEGLHDRLVNGYLEISLRISEVPGIHSMMSFNLVRSYEIFTNILFKGGIQ